MKTIKTILWTLAAVFLMLLAIGIYIGPPEKNSAKTANKQDVVNVAPNPEESPVAANPKTPRERCAEAMAKLSEQDFNIECGPLRKEEIYEAKKLAHQINPAAEINITEEDSAPNTEGKADITNPSLGLTFAEVSKGFDEFGMTFESAPLANGESRMMASSDNTKAISTLEVMGDPDNVNRVSLMTGAVKDNPSINLGNITCMLILLNNTMPEWEGRGKWLEAAIKKVSKTKTSEKAKQEIVQGDKKVKLSLIKELGMYFLNIQHKDHKESD